MASLPGPHRTRFSRLRSVAVAIGFPLGPTNTKS